MRIIGIDPGKTIGIVIYDARARVLEFSCDTQDLDVVRKLLRAESRRPVPPLVAVERMQASGIAGRDIFETVEQYGQIIERALMYGLDVLPLYRREVKKALDVGKGNADALVKHRICEVHGLTMKTCKGTKKAPGPFFGIAGHSWQAFGVAVAAAMRADLL